MFDNFKLNVIKIKRLETAVLKVYKEMPSCFYTSDLIKKVRIRTCRNHYDGTILRILRALRQDKKLKYEVLDHETSYYHKKY